MSTLFEVRQQMHNFLKCWHEAKDYKTKLALIYELMKLDLTVIGAILDATTHKPDYVLRINYDEAPHTEILINSPGKVIFAPDKEIVSIAIIPAEDARKKNPRPISRNKRYVVERQNLGTKIDEPIESWLVCEVLPTLPGDKKTVQRFNIIAQSLNKKHAEMVAFALNSTT